MEATNVIEQAETLVEVEDTIAVLRKLDAELERLHDLRARFAERYPPRCRSTRCRCRIEGCERPMMSRPYDGESGRGFCREHLEALTARERRKLEKVYRERMARARATRKIKTGRRVS
jgi:hypothetical protein